MIAAPMTHGSLSTGIGGFDIGATENKIKTLWTVEIDPLRRDVLKWKNPKAKHYEDIRTIKKLPHVNIISFGFPCQDISQANPYGEGLEGKKSSLFFDGWRIIRTNRPDYIILENSPMLIHKGLGTILGLLAEAGYNAEWDIISCKRFGLPHLRKRLFIIGHTNKIRRKTSDRVQRSKHHKILSPEIVNHNKLQSEFNGNNSWEAWNKTIRSVHHLDDGIPKNILYGLLEAAGDTVSPKITSWIFSKIREAQTKN